MLLRARDEDGEALTDRELRDELLTLVLAGHETTANSLAWAWERLVRTPDAYDELCDAVAHGDRADKADQIEYVIHGDDALAPGDPDRRPPRAGAVAARRVRRPGGHADLDEHPARPPPRGPLPRALGVQPQRWVGHKPGTYEWIPFGGGTRRCLGASLAMAEMRVVLERMAARLELEPDRPEAEHVQHRNVTMIPKRGASVIIRDKK